MIMRCYLFCVLLLLPQLLSAQTDQSLIKKEAHHEWHYNGDYGPEHWIELDPSYNPCGGTHQSPIDIITNQSVNTSIDIEFHYHPFFVDLLNDGHTLIERVIEAKALTFDGIDYTLLQFHFHTPSEHHVNGKAYPLEMHFVHQNEKGHYAVVAVLVEKGEKSNPFIAHFMKTLPTHVNEELKSKEQADPIETMPAHYHRFYYYTGSFTTPPCTEGIKWIVLEEAVGATNEQIEAIHAIIKNDNRPLQDLNDRVVYHHSEN